MGICIIKNVIDPLIAAVEPKSLKNSFLEVYLLMFARQYPKEEPISPAAVAMAPTVATV